MSTTPWSLDSESKRWLTILGVAFVASLAILMHSFFKALSPPDQDAAALRPPPAHTEEVRTKAEPMWNNAQPVHAVEQAQVDNRVNPFAAQDAARARGASATPQQLVHKQADYLRQLIAEDKVPAGLGHLTKERVDEMEKNGISIE